MPSRHCESCGGLSWSCQKRQKKHWYRKFQKDLQRNRSSIKANKHWVELMLIRNTNEEAKEECIESQQFKLRHKKIEMIFSQLEYYNEGLISLRCIFLPITKDIFLEYSSLQTILLFLFPWLALTLSLLLIAHFTHKCLWFSLALRFFPWFAIISCLKFINLLLE